MRLAGEGHALLDDDGALGAVVGRVEHEGLAGLHRTTPVDEDSALRLPAAHPEPLEQVREGHRLEGPVHHQPHGTGGVVANHVDDALDESRIAHVRRGHE